MNWIKRIVGAIVTTCLCLGAFAEAANPKSDEVVLAKKWSEEHLGREVTVPPFAFTYGGQPSTEFLKDWTRKSSSKELDDGRTQQTLTWTDSRTGLEVRCEVVNYHHFPTVEWTVYLVNKGTSDTPILENIKALDMRLERATKDKKGEFLLHHHVGSPASRFDYAPLETPLPPKATKSVGAKGGRPTNSDWSYFNLEWDGRGMIVVLGWPGQWSADFRRDAGTGLQVQGGQELTHLKLYPGEEIRTPLVVLQFWKGGDWIDAQNVWRRWMSTYNVPRVNGKPPAPQLAGATCYLFNYTKNTEENQNFFIKGFREKGLRLDSWWIDAGWYPCGDSWPKTGSWWPDPARFPRGLKAISECAHANSVKLIVWCEPERVAAGTWLTQTHPEWILGGAKGGLLNLGDPEALRWATDHFDKLLTEQGIDVYRQDFNMDPLDHWRRNDTPDRQGMTEMRHVLGYLKFWDELRHRHPDLLIDSCASGGRRNDLETMRRSVPLWRSDYVYEAVGEQIHTYGISFWIPYHGSGHTLVLQGDKKEIDLYAFRSNLYPCIHAHYDVRRDDLDYDRLRRLIGQWEQMSEYYYGDYYPLTACSSSGTLEDQTWMAWQFNRPASGDGMVQAFRRSRCNLYAGRFPLRGLQSDAQYEIVDLDQPNPTVATGKDLLENGLPITIPDKPGAVVVIYKKRSPSRTDATWMGNDRKGLTSSVVTECDGRTEPASCGGYLAKHEKYYVRTEFKNEDTQKGIFDELDEAKACCDSNYVYGYKVYSATGEVVYTTYGELAADILREGKYVTDYIRKNSFTYGNAPINPAIDHTAKLVSCDRLVGWVMYRVGFTNQPHTNGLWIWAPGDEKDLEEWCKSNQFKKVAKQEDLLPGDIVFVSRKIKDRPGHTFVHAGVAPDSTCYRYDGGSGGRIQREQPSSERIIDFLFAYRPVRQR